MKKFVITIIAILTLIPSIAFASSDQSATLAGNFSIYYNGYDQHYRDANGNTIFPIVLNGTTYLPVRRVAELAGLYVKWDAASRTVALKSGGAVTEYRGGASSRPTQVIVDLDSSIKITLDGKVQNVPAPFIYNGTTYLPVRAICDMVGIPVEWRSDTKTILLGTYLHEASPSAIIPADAKVLTDKDMIKTTTLTGVSYINGVFSIKTDGGVIRAQGIDFNNEGYKTLTFTVTTGDVEDKGVQDINVIGRSDVNTMGDVLSVIPQAYGVTKTYSADISGYKVGEISVGAGMSANAIISNIYLTK